MTKIDIISGFLGAGKTTLIQKLLSESLKGTKVVLIENEFGQVGIDGGFLKESGVEMREMSQGCICCSLVGDFETSLKEVLDTYTPERVIIEPSGVGKLSDVIKAIQGVSEGAEVNLSSAVTVIDAKKCKNYAKNFGEFFLNQVEHAGLVILSRTSGMDEGKISDVMNFVREHNKKAPIISTPWEELSGDRILSAMEEPSAWMDELLKELEEEAHHHGHHHHHHHGEEHGHHHHHGDGECCCGHHHEEEHEHHHHEEHGHHHHHHGDGECCCGHHHGEHGHHHHHHGEDCDCGHHHHDADEIFDSWGKETPASYSRSKIESILASFDADDTYGQVIRAKGMVPDSEGGWIFFDYVPGEHDVRKGTPDLTGRVCVIGADLQESLLENLFK